MVFPTVERVSYKVNPLVEVVIQLNFMKPLSARHEFSLVQLTSLHRELSERFPFFTNEIQAGFRIDFNSAGLNGSPAASSQTNHAIYHLASERERVSISEEWLIFTTTQYESWELFFGTFQNILSVFIKHFPDAGAVSRLGLRYRDIIQRSVLGLDGVSWSELIQDKISSRILLDDPELMGGSCVAVFKLEDGVLSATSALLQNAENGEMAFMIDGDFFCEGVIEYAGIGSRLASYNKQARDFFRWSITERLHIALNPSLR